MCGGMFMGITFNPNPAQAGGSVSATANYAGTATVVRTVLRIYGACDMNSTDVAGSSATCSTTASTQAGVITAEAYYHTEVNTTITESATCQIISRAGD
jgi:hypothetical protein